jgi:hypothetical protein
MALLLRLVGGEVPPTVLMLLAVELVARALCGCAVAGGSTRETPVADPRATVRTADSETQEM